MCVREKKESRGSTCFLAAVISVILYILSEYSYVVD